MGAQDDAAVKSSPNLSPIWEDVHIQRLIFAVPISCPLRARAFSVWNSSIYMGSLKPSGILPQSKVMKLGVGKPGIQN